MVQRTIAIVAVVVIAIGALVGVFTLTGILIPTSPSISKVDVKIVAGSSLQPTGWTVASGYSISDNYYNPSTIKVKIGGNNTIRWILQESVYHTVIVKVKPAGASQPTELQLFNSGDTAELTLTAPGIYEYSCTPHPWMGGRIIVER